MGQECTCSELGGYHAHYCVVPNSIEYGPHVPEPWTEEDEREAYEEPPSGFTPNR